MEKSALKSKTFWFGVATALAPLLPVVRTAVVENPETFAMLWGAATVVLRFVTKDKVVLLP